MWRRLTEPDIAGHLSQREIDAFRKSGSVEGRDPLETILGDTALLVRAYVRKSGSARLSADPLAIPGSLMSAACDYAVFDLLKRINVPVNEARMKARADALALFEQVRKGELTVEGDGEEDFASSSAATPACIAPNPPRLLD